MRKGMAAGAMAVAMFTTTVPAMASNGLGLEHEIGLSLPAGQEHGKSERDGKFAETQAGAALKSDLKELKSLTKDVRNDLRSGWKEHRFHTEATSSAQASARKQCKKEARDAYVDAAAKARDERDSGLKAAVDANLAALKSARSAYQSVVEAGASSTSDVVAAAHETYRKAITDAQKAFRAAKVGIFAAYRTELKAAHEAEKAAKDACRI